MFTVRTYQSTDEPNWLRCRLLSFFTTAYYDDVITSRPDEPGLLVRLVAVDGSALVGLIDLEVDGTAATIDCIAVHPDHHRTGIGSALLAAARADLPDSARTLDAWTRDDAAANGWYRSRGFVENYRYLHVYKDHDEAGDGFTVPERLRGPVKAFLHAEIADEEKLRQRFRRVHVCRQYLLDL
ncbi:MAG: GNAT family N-acetyltransferase [Propionibacteriaceae bacterium]